MDSISKQVTGTTYNYRLPILGKEVCVRRSRHTREIGGFNPSGPNSLKQRHARRMTCRCVDRIEIALKVRGSDFSRVLSQPAIRNVFAFDDAANLSVHLGTGTVGTYNG